MFDTAFIYMVVVLVMVQKLVYMLYQYVRVLRVSWKVRGFPDTHILLGDLRMKTYEEYFERSVRFVQNTGARMHKIWIYCFYPVYSINHPETAKMVLTKSTPKLNSSGSGYTILKPWIGDGLLTNVGDKKWARHRQLLTPAFSFDMMKSYAQKCNDAADELLIHVSQCRDTSIEICQPVYVATLDALLQCACSYDGNIQDYGLDHPYVSTVHRLRSYCLHRMSNPLLYPDFIFKRTRTGKRFYTLCDYVHKFADDTIKRRRKEQVPSEVNNEENNDRLYKDFLDVVLTARDSEGNGLTDSEVRVEVNNFLFAGHDTTSASICWGIYAIAQYPDIQDLVHKEVIAVVGTEEVQMEHLEKLKYVHCFINEVMRMFSIVPIIERGLQEPLIIDGVTLPAGTQLEINIHAINHRIDVWSDHEEFRPERFEKASEVRDAFSYIPFSKGRRNCIGQNFAIMVQKVFICRLVQMFHMELDDGHKVISTPKLVMRAKHGIRVFLKPR